MEIGWSYPHEMKSVVVVWTCDDDQALGLQKEEREKQNGLNAMVILNRAILFW